MNQMTRAAPMNKTWEEMKQKVPIASRKTCIMRHLPVRMSHLFHTYIRDRMCKKKKVAITVTVYPMGSVRAVVCLITILSQHVSQVHVPEIIHFSVVT